MLRPKNFMYVLLLAGVVACEDDDAKRFGSFGGSGASGGDDTGSWWNYDDSGSGTSGSDDSGSMVDDTGSEGVQSFDEPGDTITFEDNDGDAEVPLEDVGGESNQDQEFYLVLINSGTSGVGYNLTYITPSEDEPIDTGLGDSGLKGEGGEAAHREVA